MKRIPDECRDCDAARQLEQEADDKVCNIVHLIYRARTQAAAAIVREIFSGEIDVNAEQLSFELNGGFIRYSLYRVRELAGVRELPIELLARSGRSAANPIESAHRSRF